MMKSSFYCMMHSLQSTYIFRMKTISDFPSTIWNLTSVKHNSDSVKTTSFCLSMFCKYQQIWLILKELFLVDWKAFVFYSENWYIHVNTVIYYKDFDLPVPELSMISSTIVNYIYENHMNLLAWTFIECFSFFLL